MAGCYIREVSAVSQSQHKRKRSEEPSKIETEGEGEVSQSSRYKVSLKWESMDHRATVTRRLLLALFVIISIFLAIDSTLFVVFFFP